MVKKDFFGSATLGDIFTKEMLKEFALVMQPLVQTKLIDKAKEEGRVEGVIGELKDTLTTLKAIDNILDSYESAQSLKLLIKVKEKRLKNLESGKV